MRVPATLIVFCCFCCCGHVSSGLFFSHALSGLGYNPRFLHFFLPHPKRIVLKPACLATFCFFSFVRVPATHTVFCCFCCCCLELIYLVPVATCRPIPRNLSVAAVTNPKFKPHQTGPCLKLPGGAMFSLSLARFGRVLCTVRL